MCSFWIFAHPVLLKKKEKQNLMLDRLQMVSRQRIGLKLAKAKIRFSAFAYSSSKNLSRKNCPTFFFCIYIRPVETKERNAMRNTNRSAFLFFRKTIAVCLTPFLKRSYTILIDNFHNYVYPFMQLKQCMESTDSKSAPKA